MAEAAPPETTTSSAGVPYSQMSIMVNMGQIDYCRTTAAVASGCAAGILGLTGIQGFVFYFIMAAIVSLMILIQIGKDWKKYFITRQQFVTHGFLGGIFTYILFWTFLYGMVHVY